VADIIFWFLFFIIIVGLSIPMFRYLDKNLYDGEMKKRFKLKKLKTLFSFIVVPFLCSSVYTIAPFNSLASFITFWTLGFVISSIVFWLNAQKNKDREDNETLSSDKSATKTETFYLLLSLAVPNIQLFFLFSFILAGFHIPW